jgi:hypothetical protein
MKKRVWLLVVTVFGGLLLVGCAADDVAPEAALVISDMTVAVGAVDESTAAEQTLTFSLTLLNQSETPIFVRSVEPRPVPDLQQRLLNETTFLPVDQSIPPGETIEVGSQWLFQTPGMSKEEIDATFAAGYFAGMRATVEMELSVPGETQE